MTFAPQHSLKDRHRCASRTWRARSSRKTGRSASSDFRLQMVSMSEIDVWLERLFWIAMISIPFLAIWAGRIALRQVQTASQQVDAALQEAQTTKLFKILRHVEEQRVRDARHIVMSEIHRQEEEGKNWWEGDERLQRAAEQLCASYDHLGGIIKFDGPDRVGQYFLERWGEGVKDDLRLGISPQLVGCVICVSCVSDES